MYQSFMDFCDDAEIATEGAVYEISSYAKILSKRVNLLQIQLKNNAGDKRAQIKAIDDTIEQLDRVGGKIKKLEISNSRVTGAKVLNGLAMVTSCIGIILSLTVVGLGVGVPLIGASMLISGKNPDIANGNFKQNILTDINSAKKHLIQMKSLIGKGTPAEESLKDVLDEKKQLRKDMKNAGYGALSGLKFRKDASKAKTYLSNEVIATIKKNRAKDLTELRKIAEEVVKRFDIELRKRKYNKTRTVLNDFNQAWEFHYDKSIDALPSMYGANVIGWYIAFTGETDQAFGDGYLEDDLIEVAYEIRRKYASKLKKINSSFDIKGNNDEFVSISFTINI